MIEISCGILTNLTEWAIQKCPPNMTLFVFVCLVLANNVSRVPLLLCESWKKLSAQNSIEIYLISSDLCIMHVNVFTRYTYLIYSLIYM